MPHTSNVPERHPEAFVTWEQLQQWAERHEEGERVMLAAINQKMDQILLTLTGDGTDTRPGITLRLDRLERSASQDHKVKDWLAKGALGAVGAWFATKYLN